MKKISAAANKGLTLIEAVVIIAITLMITQALITTIIYFYRTNANVVAQSYAVNYARRGMDFLVRDIREAGYGDEGSFPIVSIAPTEFTFYSDIDRDDYSERIHYYLAGGTLYKGVTNPTGTPLSYGALDEEVTVISEHVRNDEEGVSIFKYYDSEGAEITGTNVSEVAFVTVTLIVNVNPDRQPEEFTLRSSAALRNLKVNF